MVFCHKLVVNLIHLLSWTIFSLKIAASGQKISSGTLILASTAFDVPTPRKLIFHESPTPAPGASRPVTVLTRLDLWR